ncbi:MAG: hypothetical protein JRG84_14140 [Deltaproteobacteria bacterium]|nr:hypothetical protein [Deltaproteobacteria bacterium]
MEALLDPEEERALLIGSAQQLGRAAAHRRTSPPRWGRDGAQRSLPERAAE